MNIELKRIYDPVSKDDGYRVLIDRIWPRGVSKSAASLDAWVKELAPSTELRRWFGHDRERWQEFAESYERELADCDPELFRNLREHADDEGLTLLFAARDTKCNNAVVLKRYLEDH